MSAKGKKRLISNRRKVYFRRSRSAKTDAGATDIASESNNTTRGDKRRNLLVKAATEEFLKDGYEGVSLRTIVRLAGGSSDTLYQYFGDKAGLFMACAADLCSQFMSAYKLVVNDRNPEEELTSFGLAYMRNFLSPRTLETYRLMIAEAPRFPQLGQMMMKHGRSRVERLLADCLKEQTARGVFEIQDCDLAAHQFIDMIHGGLHYRRLLNIGPPPTDKELQYCVETAVRVFCKGHAPAGKIVARRKL